MQLSLDGLIAVVNYVDLPQHNYNISIIQCVSVNNRSIWKCEIRLKSNLFLIDGFFTA